MANMSSATVRFGMTCLMAIGMYASVPCILVWNSNNSAGHYKRATTLRCSWGWRIPGASLLVGLLLLFLSTFPVYLVFPPPLSPGRRP
jgi:hypothetical protein